MLLALNSLSGTSSWCKRFQIVRLSRPCLPAEWQLRSEAVNLPWFAPSEVSIACSVQSSQSFFTNQSVPCVCTCNMLRQLNLFDLLIAKLRSLNRSSSERLAEFEPSYFYCP